MKRLPSLLLAAIAAIVSETTGIASTTWTYNFPTSSANDTGTYATNGITITPVYIMAATGEAGTPVLNYSSNDGMKIGKAGSSSTIGDPVSEASFTIASGSFLAAIRSVEVLASGVSATQSKGTIETSIGGTALTPSSYGLTSTANASMRSFLNSSNASGAVKVTIKNPSASANKTSYVVNIKTISVVLNESPALNGTTIADATATVGVEKTMVIPAFATDPDGDTLVYSSNVGTITGSIWAYTPSEVGTSTVTLTATDPYGASVSTTFDVTATTSVVYDPPIVRIFTSDIPPTDAATINATVNESVSVSVTADKGDLTVEINDNPGNTSLVENSETPGTYIFSWTPSALGEYTFTISSSFTPEGASESLTGSATLTVNANALAAPEHISASASGQTVSALWDTVTGAQGYTATLYGDTAFTLDLGTNSPTTGTGCSILKGSFTGNSGETVDWTASSGRISEDDAWFDENKPAIAIKQNSPNFFMAGPFSKDILSFSFKYRRASGTGTGGNIRVYAIDANEQETEIANSTSLGMDQPISTKAIYTFSTNLVDDTISARSIKITCTTSPVLIDDFEIHTLAEVRAQDISASTTTYSFSNLSQATYYAVGVKATGSTASNESVASPEVVSELVRTAGNTQPTLSVSGATVPAGTAAVLTLNGHDDDDDELTYTVSPTGLGTIAIDDQTGAATFTYTPNAVGTTTFTFTVSDGNGGSATADAIVTATLGTPVITATAMDSRFVTLGWDAVTGAAGYRVSGSGTKVRVTGATVLEETFDKFPGALTKANTSTADGTPDDYMTLPGWTLEKVFRGDFTGSQQDLGISSNAVRVGTSSVIGSLTSPELNLSGNGGAFVVSFSARRFRANNVKQTIEVSAGGVTNTVTLTDEMAMHTAAFPAGTGSQTTQIRIAGVSGDNRFFLDDLRIVSGTATTTALTIEPAQLSVTGTTCTATGLSPEATYTFTVTAYATVGGDEVTTSASASVTTPEAPARTLILFR